MPSPRLLAPRYRSDLDGLRALAILAVLGYHAFPRLVPGGFTGVDTFFVISGFLITSIILDNIARDRFTLRVFYARRIRRIFPALATVLVGCIAIGWFVLGPVEYAALGRHVVGGALFASNLVLWRDSGYFDAAAQAKPLLHLWSLGIEEQFYLLWPPLLIAAHRLRIAPMRVIASLGTVSFAAGLLLTWRYPQAAFYLPMSRGWELLVGALLAQRALATHGGTDPRPSRTAIHEAAALAGLGLSAWAMLGFDATLAYPGWRALVPTLGAALLIAAGPGTVVARRVLSLRAVVALGLVSYPLYLWHWPLLVFAHIAQPDGVSVLQTAGLLALALVLAWGTARWVEAPLRFRMDGRRAVVSLLLLMAGIAAAGALLVWARGVESRAGEPLRAYLQPRGDAIAALTREGRCELMGTPVAFPEDCIDPATGDGRALVVVWGDSHAAMLYPGLRAIAGGAGGGHPFRIAQFTRAGCRPFLGLGYAACREGNAAVLASIARLHPDYVLLDANWNHLTFNGGAELLAQLEPTLDALQRLGVPRIVVVGPAPHWNGTLPQNLARLYATRPFLRLPSHTRFGLNPDALALDVFLRRALAQRKVPRYVSLTDLLCDARGCLTHVDEDPGELTTWDYGHLAPHASRLVARRLSAELDGFAAVSQRPVPQPSVPAVGHGDATTAASDR